MSDFESEAIMFLYQTCGDIEKNFSDSIDNQTLINMIIGRVKIFLREKMIEQLRINSKFKPSSHFYEKVNFEKNGSSNYSNTDEEVFALVVDETSESQIMSELIRRFENGMNKEQLLESIQLDFNISKEALLELLNRRLEQKKKNKEVQDDSVLE